VGHQVCVAADQVRVSHHCRDVPEPVVRHRPQDELS
jgi:hypothetical protein